MKIPYKTELINLLLILVFMLIGLATYELIITPDPMTNYVIPSIFWELGATLTLATATWPTSLTIWVFCILYLINYFRVPIKAETKTDIIERLRRTNSGLKQELSYANFRLAERQKKLVYAEALLKSNRCPSCLELHEE